MDVDDTDLMLLLTEQRRELTTAIATDSDLDFAFQLQMQEALNASSSTHHQHQHPLLLLPEITNTSIASLLANELDDFDRQRLDHHLAQAQARTMQDNLNRLIHDQAFARQIDNVPEHEWVRTGDNIERPYGVSTTELKEECFKVYVSGLVSDETVMGVGVVVFGGIGVAVCDSCDCCVFELGKPVVGDGGGGGVDGDVVEVMALVEGLTAASTLGLKRVLVYCDSDSVYHYLTGKGQPPSHTCASRNLKPRSHKIKTLVDQLSVIQRKFAYCGPILERQNNIKFAHKLARDAIKSEANKFANRISGKTLLEQCIICFDSIYSGQMFSVNKCLHRYCFSCMRKHVEAKLLQGKLPECPHENCKTELEIESCKQFLTSELNDIMSLRVKEASIPPADKVYCPFSNCSFLMSKTELQEYMVYTPGSSSAAAMGPGMRKCVKCDRRFCINCKVPWHDDYTCERYMKCFPHQSPNEAKLKSLATRNQWRACTKCKNLVELAEGCYHIFCRCGYEFCYTCGAEWINKKPTCRCPIWDERNIISQRNPV